jgi:hypothetical protein
VETSAKYIIASTASKEGIRGQPGIKVVFIKLARTLDYLNISILHFIFTVK